MLCVGDGGGVGVGGGGLRCSRIGNHSRTPTGYAPDCMVVTLLRCDVNPSCERFCRAGRYGRACVLA